MRDDLLKAPDAAACKALGAWRDGEKNPDGTFIPGGPITNIVGARSGEMGLWARLRWNADKILTQPETITAYLPRQFLSDGIIDPTAVQPPDGLIAQGNTQ